MTVMADEHRRARIHRLILVDRGLGHVHRWRPECSCGWIGVQRRRKKDAKTIHRAHIATELRDEKRRHPGGGLNGQAGRLTPPSDLPEALR